ncbi:hypothetical protein GCM10022393_37650 [Aquimarina addita]|uniref:DUF4293 family protein n=1 Tax=Aquimarina addita TaxID=870485 RepID=A0ABP6UVY3_9FLAO
MKNLLFILNAIFLIVVLFFQSKSYFDHVNRTEAITGYMWQFALGIVQLLTGICFFIYWKKHHTVVRKGLIIYWSVVALYVLVTWIVLNGDYFSINNIETILMKSVPLCIAIYFVGITYLNRTYKRTFSLSN